MASTHLSVAKRAIVLTPTADLQNGTTPRQPRSRYTSAPAAAPGRGPAAQGAALTERRRRRNLNAPLDAGLIDVVIDAREVARYAPLDPSGGAVPSAAPQSAPRDPREAEVAREDRPTRQTGLNETMKLKVRRASTHQGNFDKKET